jgi:hypothetical protein
MTAEKFPIGWRRLTQLQVRLGFAFANPSQPSPPAEWGEREG